MLYKNVNIETIAYEKPPVGLTSDAIEERLKPTYDKLKLPSGRLELMSGIKERRFWHPGTMPSDGATLAGEKALQQAGISRDKIGCLINCSVCRDFLEPATATVVHHNLNLPQNAVVFDISNACLGILSGMITLANMIELGQVEAGILVAGENAGSLVESTIQMILNDDSINRKTIKPLFASLTIGSGAIAVVMTNKSISTTNHELVGGMPLAATQYNDLCRGNADKGMDDGATTIMNTDSETLMLRGIETAAKNWEMFKAETGWTNDDVDCTCTHQVGSAHKKLLIESLKLDASKDFATLETWGNVGSVSCPLTAAVAAEEGILKSGDKLALLGIGSGINSTMLGINW